MSESATTIAPKGKVIGRFLDMPIYDWVMDGVGQRYDFVRALPVSSGESFDLELAVNECVIMPGLLYRMNTGELPCGYSGMPDY